MLSTIVKVGAFVAVALLAFVEGQSKNYPPACILDDPSYVNYKDAPKLHKKNGFEIFIQAPIYALINQNVFSTLPEKLQYPINETFFIRYFEDNNQGSMFIAGKHKMIQLLHDRKSNESILVDYQYGSCDVQPMIIEPEFPYGYFHGTEKPIHVPFPEEFADLTNFKIKKLGKMNYPYRGFHGVDRYEGCINLRSILVRVLSELQSISIPPELIQAVPDVAVKVIWYWADQTWEMEDGQYAVTGPVPLGIDLIGAVSIKTPGNRLYADLAVNATMVFANYHSKYPPHDVHHDLLQVPAGIWCPRRIFAEGDTPPMAPIFPTKFHIKTETIMLSDTHSFIYNTEDYYDYDKQKFRFDITLHRPEKKGPVTWQLYHDYANDVAYKVVPMDYSCEKKSISETQQGGRFDDNPVTHMLMRPYDLMQLSEANPVYIGKKPCRGMTCHYWTGRKHLNFTVNGNPTYGHFGIWATTDKWTANFSSGTPIMENYIVKLEMTIFDRKSHNMIGVEHLDIFDYRTIGGQHDIFFEGPTATFCGNEENPGMQPHMPHRYQYRAEYTDHSTNSSTPVFLNYDAGYNVVRFDWTDTTGKKVNFRESYVYDLRSSLSYHVNRVSGECRAKQISNDYQPDLQALQFLWPPMIQGLINQQLMQYVGVYGCRRAACDTFEWVDKHYSGKNGQETVTHTYQFFTDNFKSISPDNPSFVTKNGFARVGHHHLDAKDMPEHNASRYMEVFDFHDARSTYWEYEVVGPCFADVRSHWIRIYFTSDDAEGYQYVYNDIFRVEMMDQLRKNASNITPLRISSLYAYTHGTGASQRVVAEFLLRDKHPLERYFGPSLHDATQSLQESVNSGSFHVVIYLTPPEGGATKKFVFTADTSFEVCQKNPCSQPDSSMPIVEFDTGALVGTIIGSFFGGVLILFAVMTVVFSKKYNVSMMSLYASGIPSAPSAAGNQELVNSADNSPNDADN